MALEARVFSFPGLLCEAGVMSSCLLQKLEATYSNLLPPFSFHNLFFSLPFPLYLPSLQQIVTNVYDVMALCHGFGGQKK